jgi:hypothetical protein
LPLDASTMKRIRDEAMKRGADPEKALAEAERLRASSTPKAPAAEADAPAEKNGRPLADRLLIGFLPFIKVRELRTHWLGLPDSIPDDDLTCGDYQLKHGGGAAAAPAPDGAPE